MSINATTIQRIQRTCTPAELIVFVLTSLSESNARDVLEYCPSDVRVMLRDAIESMPTNYDDESWAGHYYGLAVYYGNGVTEDEIKIREQDRNRKFREGVRLFRRYAPL
jgi:hypothetical protein